jgi:hypothetical protein
MLAAESFSLKFTSFGRGCVCLIPIVLDSLDVVIHVIVDFRD